MAQAAEASSLEEMLKRTSLFDISAASPPSSEELENRRRKKKKRDDYYVCKSEGRSWQDHFSHCICQLSFYVYR
jgi:hypothetical protein